MKRYILICLLMIGAVCNVIAGPRRCTEQDIPMDVRATYIQQARQMIEAYYTQLPLCIGEPMVKEAFIANFMQDGKSAYKPEFLPKAKYDAMLEPQQYLQELDKLALKLGEGELSFDIQKFSVNHKDFFAPSMVSCYLRANYQLVIKWNDSRLATRECEAYCLFPRAAVSINVKLMQVDVTKGEDYRIGQKSETTANVSSSTSKTATTLKPSSTSVEKTKKTTDSDTECFEGRWNKFENTIKEYSKFYRWFLPIIWIVLSIGFSLSPIEKPFLPHLLKWAKWVGLFILSVCTIAIVDVFFELDGYSFAFILGVGMFGLGCCLTYSYIKEKDVWYWFLFPLLFCGVGIFILLIPLWS